VRLPQTSAAFKATLIALVLLSPLAAGPALAEDEAEAADRPTLFSCGTDPVNDSSFLDLSGVELDFDSFADLRFEQRAENGDKIVYSFPPAGTDSKTAFLFSHSTGPEGYLVSIRWVDGDNDYVYYSLDIPPDPGVADDAGGGAAGLAISRKGELVERISCAERPYMFISYMRHAMSCDVGNPYGEGACGESTWLREQPLDTDRLGIVPARD